MNDYQISPHTHIFDDTALTVQVVRLFLGFHVRQDQRPPKGEKTSRWVRRKTDFILGSK
jgi:hypothetical protein